MVPLEGLVQIVHQFYSPDVLQKLQRIPFRDIASFNQFLKLFRVIEKLALLFQFVHHPLAFVHRAKVLVIDSKVGNVLVYIRREDKPRLCLLLLDDLKRFEDLFMQLVKLRNSLKNI